MLFFFQRWLLLSLPLDLTSRMTSGERNVSEIRSLGVWIDLSSEGDDSGRFGVNQGMQSLFLLLCISSSRIIFIAGRRVDLLVFLGFGGVVFHLARIFRLSLFTGRGDANLLYWN